MYPGQQYKQQQQKQQPPPQGYPGSQQNQPPPVPHGGGYPGGGLVPSGGAPPQYNYQPPPTGYGAPPQGYGPPSYPQGGYGQPIPPISQRGTYPGNYAPPAYQQPPGSFHNQGPPQPVPYGQPPAGAPVPYRQFQAGAPVSYGQPPAGAPVSYGQPPAGAPVSYGQPPAGAPGLVMQNNMGTQPAPNFQLSNCTGRKRALLIGINYTGTRFELQGCLNDVKNIKRFIMEFYNFREDDMVILTDDTSDYKRKPTRDNMIKAMRWLVHDARPHDSFFFHYSGHGGQAKDLDGDEDDGFDETILPLDFETAGQIIDDEMHDIMVRPLPPGVRLTAIFDSCHSGTALDLPYVYSTQGIIKETNILKEGGNAILNAGMSYLKKDFKGISNSFMGFGRKAMSGKKIAEKNRQTKSSPADVIMFSGCKDIQTSADANEGGESTGAMSYAFITSLLKNRNVSYQYLLNEIREVLAAKYSQRPQLSSSHPMDMNLMFMM